MILSWLWKSLKFSDNVCARNAWKPRQAFSKISDSRRFSGDSSVITLIETWCGTVTSGSCDTSSGPENVAGVGVGGGDKKREIDYDLFLENQGMPWPIALLKNLLLDTMQKSSYWCGTVLHSTDVIFSLTVLFSPPLSQSVALHHIWGGLMKTDVFKYPSIKLKGRVGENVMAFFHWFKIQIRTWTQIPNPMAT